MAWAGWKGDFGHWNDSDGYDPCALGKQPALLINSTAGHRAVLSEGKTALISILGHSQSTCGDSYTQVKVYRGKKLLLGLV